MKDFVKLVGVLTVISLIAGLSLAMAYQITLEPIAEAKRQEKLAALAKVLPEYDNDPYESRRAIADGDTDWTFYVARQGESVAGVAFETASPGYGGDIVLMVGIKDATAIQAVEVLEALQETPGLGAKVNDAEFRAQFEGKAADNTDWCAVKQDGGDIDAITGATISSRAVCKALKNGLAAFQKHEGEL
jgi:electron transport complex protein RnfG